MSWFQKVLRWLGQGSDHVESSTPKGWYVRGFAIALLILIPASLWVVGHGAGVPDRGLWVLRNCPPVSPIPRAELAEHPQRFRGRFLWIVGVVRVLEKRCSSMSCREQEDGKKCCPCQARLAIGSPPHQFPISGFLPHQKRPLVGCRGTSCALDCQPFVPGKVYAVAGKPVIANVAAAGGSAAPTALMRPRFKVRSFRIHRACRVIAALPLYQRRRLPEPTDRATPKRGGTRSTFKPK